MSYAKAVARQAFSTKSFVPGHVVGAAAILFGTIALAKAFIERHEAETRERSMTVQQANARGKYGRNP